MKKTSTLLAATLLTFGLLTAQAQLGGGRSATGPDFGGAVGKLFGDNQAFTATVEIQSTNQRTGQPVTVPGSLSFDAGKTWFKVNLMDIKGGSMPAGAATQLRSMGMDTMVTISLPATKTAYILYPKTQCYVDMPTPGGIGNSGPDDYTVESAPAGKETVQGHECVKDNVTLTDKNGNKHEFTVWDAADLNNFPVQIEMNEQGRQLLMVFKDVSLKKPDASLFLPPAGFTKYNSMQEMMQAVMMKQMGGSMAHPPGQ